MFKRKKIISKDILTLPLALTSEEGDILTSFKPDVVDSLRHMASRFVQSSSLPKRLAFVSALRQEGVTYISRAWGVMLANDFQVNVAVLELNWWWPDTIKAIKDSSDGLAAVYHKEQELDEVIVPTGLKNFSIIPAGNLRIDERPVFARSEALQDMIYNLSLRFDHLVLDIPAILATNDAIPLASLGEKTCLVIQQGVTNIEKVKQALDDISGLPVMGVILNQVQTHVPVWMLNLIPQDVNSLTGN